jgi:prepilin-type N-terminal cleavage/methylation domain-containing protein
MIRRREVRSDRGETLVEVLVSVAILGIAGVAILTGMGISAKASDIHRKETTGSAYTKSFAEAIQDWVAAGNYMPCANPQPNYVTVPSVATKVALPSGYSASQDGLNSISSSGSQGACAASGDDTGVQQLKIKVSSSDNRGIETLYVVVRRPCAIGQAACG